MKQQIETLLLQAIKSLINAKQLPAETQANIQISRSKDQSLGDFACNLALMLAKPAKKNPRELAQQLVDAMPSSDVIEKVEIAGPGFINFFINQSSSLSVVGKILQEAEKYGLKDIGVGKKIQVEFVSANPTGPLHVGHGRGAAYGATVADLLAAMGFEVDREYYVNDAGRQMDILASSIWLRYLQESGVDVPFPCNGYQGEYVFDIARDCLKLYGNEMLHKLEDVMLGIPDDEPAGGDKETHIDALISRAKALLGEEAYLKIFNQGLNTIIADIKEDLEGFGVVYQNWYSERSLGQRGLIKKAIDKLQAAGYMYEKGGAQWFKSTEFGDEKDRVVVRDNGQETYFASDIAYHMEKLERGYDRIIDVWGADHHGYVPRVKAALKALGNDADKMDVLLVQFASLYRSGEKVQMSTRSGSFVTLRELREEVGSDAARFFYVMRKCEQHMDFDLDLAKSQSNENPMYYIQYAHARICSVLRQLTEKSFSHNIKIGEENLNLLTEKHEVQILTSLAKYPEHLEKSALNEEPHILVHFLRELANELHSYYNAHHFIVEDEKLRNARLNLIIATRHVLKNGLKLLGVSAPETM